MAVVGAACPALPAYAGPEDFVIDTFAQLNPYESSTLS